jgi:O-Antigen ligase
MTTQPDLSFLNSSITSDQSKRDTAQSWLVILACAMLTLMLMLLPLGSLGRIIVPVVVVVTGFVLYAKSATMYMAFTWWIWFLAPLVSRVIEYRSGVVTEEFRLLIAAPYMVSFISVEMFVKQIPRFSQLDGLPFALAGVSVGYALLIGFTRGYPLVQIGQEFLSWSAPICFGFFMLANWRRYELFKRMMQVTFLCITLFVAVYGIYQYLAPLPWDVFWWENAPNIRNASGIAAPKLVRVWSTLNTTFIFGYAMVACLGVTLSWSRMISIPALIVGIISLLLSQVRVAWIALCLALLVFGVSTHPRVSQRSLIVLVLSISLAMPLAAHPDFNEVIQSRLESFSQGQEDESLQERQNIYKQTLQSLLDPSGRGLGGAKIIDAGAADVISTLGWVGVSPMLFGVMLAFQRLFRSMYRDSFRTILQAVAIAFFSTLAFNNIFILLSGQIFWSFIGLALASDRYYKMRHREHVTSIYTGCQYNN